MSFAVTAKLIFLFAHAKCWISHDVAHLFWVPTNSGVPATTEQWNTYIYLWINEALANLYWQNTQSSIYIWLLKIVKLIVDNDT